MKKIVLIFLILFSGLTCAQNITVKYFSEVDSGKTVGTAVVFPRSLFLGGIIIPDSLSDSCYFQTRDSGEWVNIVDNEGGTIYVTFKGIGSSCAVAVDPKSFYPFKIIRPIFTDKPLKKRQVYLIGREY